MLFYDLLTPEQRTTASEFGTAGHYPSRSLIIRQGERANGIHVILEGIVESVYYTESDRELRLATWGEQDFVGAPNVFGDARQKWSARALSSVYVLHLNQDQLRELINTNPAIAVTLIQALGYKGERYSQLAQRLAFHTVRERLALALLDEWHEAQQHNSMFQSLPVPSPLELSRTIGSTRQAVGNAMRALSSRGLLQIENGRFSLPHIQGLKKLAGTETLQS